MSYNLGINFFMYFLSLLIITNHFNTCKRNVFIKSQIIFGILRIQFIRQAAHRFQCPPKQFKTFIQTIFNKIFNSRFPFFFF